MNQFISLQRGVIYGPVKSKRLGQSLGINLLPTDGKVCSFNCIYCFYGPTDFSNGPQNCPPKDLILKKIEEALIKKPRVNYLTFSGNGEPTLHPDFAEIAAGVKELRDRYLPQIPIALISNSSTLSDPKIRGSLKSIDRPIFKMDCGDEDSFLKINGPRTGIRLSEIIENLAALRAPTIQSVIIGNGIKNYTGEVFEKWMAALKKINPSEVQIYSLDHSLEEKGIKKVPGEILRQIEEFGNGKLKMGVRAYF